jgi:hypothetical protein
MAPIAISPDEDVHKNGNDTSTKHRNARPLKKSGALDGAFKFEDVTPAIGRVYPTTNIVDDLLNSNDADALLRDLAITSKLKFPSIPSVATIS